MCLSLAKAENDSKMAPLFFYLIITHIFFFFLLRFFIQAAVFGVLSAIAKCACPAMFCHCDIGTRSFGVLPSLSDRPSGTATQTPLAARPVASRCPKLWLRRGSSGRELWHPTQTSASVDHRLGWICNRSLRAVQPWIVCVVKCLPANPFHLSTGKYRKEPGVLVPAKNGFCIWMYKATIPHQINLKFC